MREKIKILLREFEFNEAEETTHSKERVDNRVFNKKSYQTTNVPDKLSASSYEDVKYRLELVKKVDFPDGIQFAINLGYAPSKDSKNPKDFDSAKGFYYDDPSNSKDSGDSWGHILWLVIKDNSMVTVSIHREQLKDKSGKPYIEVKPDNLKKYLTNFKGYEIPDTISGLKGIDKMDLTSIEDFVEMRETSYAPINKNEEEILTIGDEDYVINRVEKTFYPKFRPKRKKKILDYYITVVNDIDASDKEINLAEKLEALL
jgi:hypothetical protein